MEILLTNDDGIHAEGLAVLRRALHPLGRVWVVAPEREQSGASHALTLHRPLRVRRLDDCAFAVDGTPTDCVLLAAKGLPDLVGGGIDLVVSGINHGPNLSDDITYSGTVAAAIEGLMLGLPAIAISNGSSKSGSFETAGEVAAFITRKAIENPLAPRVLLNVNVPSVPAGELKGYRITVLGHRTHGGRIFPKTDPRGRPYYWIGEAENDEEPVSGCDEEALRAGYVSVTPIKIDLTDHQAVDALRRWNLPCDRTR